MDLGDLIRAAESGGNNYAKNPNSTASGPDQFLDRTWIETIRTAIPGMADRPDSELLALKTNPEISGLVRDAYSSQNGAILAKAGHEVTPSNTYLAHFAGPSGAVKVLGAAPDAPVSSILGMDVVKANPFLSNMTASDLKSWASRKMDGPQPQNTPQQAPQGAPGHSLSSPMLGVGAPPNNAPAASPQPQFSVGGGSMPAQMPAQTQMAPMQMLGAQIKPRDTYRRLAALFQRQA